jgi:hypothetical protein
MAGHMNKYMRLFLVLKENLIDVCGKYLKEIGTSSISRWGIGLLEMVIVTQPVMKFPTYLEPMSSLPCSQEPPTDPYPELQEFIIR